MVFAGASRGGDGGGWVIGGVAGLREGGWGGGYKRESGGRELLRSALCKFNVQISSTSSVKISSSSDIVELGGDESDLRPTATFFEQEAGISHVCCGIIGDSKLFILPSEYGIRSSRLHPLQFDFLNNQTGLINTCPRAPKLQPHVIPIHNKVYALSLPGLLFERPSEPSFEAYHTTTGSWEPLPKPPFYDSRPYSSDVYGYFFVEQGQASYSVVFFRSPLPRFFSYNTRTSEWKPVSLPDSPKYEAWFGEAVVVGGHVYVYTPMSDLRTFPVHYREATDDLCFGLSLRIRGLPMLLLPETCYENDFNSTSIGIIRDWILCLVSTSLPDCHNQQFALVSIVQIREDNPAICDKLNSFTFGLPTTMGDLMIASCFSLAPGVTSSMEQIEEAHNRKYRVPQDVTGYGNVSSNMEMTSYVM